MGFYEERILPWLIDVAMRRRDLAPYRMRTVSAASGRVLEIGIGSGLNLPLYGASVGEIIGLDPSTKLLAMAGEAGSRPAMPLRLIGCRAPVARLVSACCRGGMQWTRVSRPPRGSRVRFATAS